MSIYLKNKGENTYFEIQKYMLYIQHFSYSCYAKLVYCHHKKEGDYCLRPSTLRF